MSSMPLQIPTDTILCPRCGLEISVTDQVTHRLRGELAKELRPQLEEEPQSLVTQQLEELNDHVQVLDAENASLKQHERELRRERETVERREADLDLIVEREAGKRVKALAQAATQNARRRYQPQIEELQETIRRMQRDLDAAGGRATQPLSELRGRAGELALDTVLSATFPHDDISEVPPLRAGADIIQRVLTPTGMVAGMILWESKRAKTKRSFCQQSVSKSVSARWNPSKEDGVGWDSLYLTEVNHGSLKVATRVRIPLGLPERDPR